jgi:hypothetical protein
MDETFAPALSVPGAPLLVTANVSGILPRLEIFSRVLPAGSWIVQATLVTLDDGSEMPAERTTVVLDPEASVSVTTGSVRQKPRDACALPTVPSAVNVTKIATMESRKAQFLTTNPPERVHAFMCIGCSESPRGTIAKKG